MLIEVKENSYVWDLEVNNIWGLEEMILTVQPIEAPRA